ncbi:MAG TPA: spore germination protein GerW family protein [Gemmatimonadales bacterium]|nr:spore germination protein GerW family protein [Gemmatimonadales bacterium]
MSTKELIEAAVDHLRSTASVKTVYGDPVVIDGKTVIPVARVAYGFGGGSGSKQQGEGENDAPAEGGGVGGGMSAKPVGVVEVTSAETKFVAFGAKKRLAIAAAIASGIGLGLGYLFGRKAHT